MLGVVGAIVLGMFVWLALPVRRRLGDPGRARRHRHLARGPHRSRPGRDRPHPADQHRLLRRRGARRPGLVAQRPPEGPARRAGQHHPTPRATRCSRRPSPTSGCASPASCTTSSPTTCRSSASRPPRARRVIDRRPAMPRRRALGVIERVRRARPSPRCASCSARCASSATSRASATAAAPEPGIDDLPALVAERTASGLRSPLRRRRVQPRCGASSFRRRSGCRCTGSPRRRSPTSARHSTARSARVVLRVDDREPASPLRRGRGARRRAAARRATSGSGLGHLGIRERVGRLGGEVRDRAAPDRRLPGAGPRARSSAGRAVSRDADAARAASSTTSTWSAPASG